jgi:hypothetical protein
MSAAHWGQLVNFEASLRKPALVDFGLFSPDDNLAFIASLPSTGAGQYSTEQGTITGTINGVNLVFSLPLGVTPITVFRNGVLMTQGTDVTVVTHTITFNAGQTPQAGDIITAYV